MGRNLLLFFFMVTTLTFAQPEVPKSYFSDVIGVNIKKYKKHANKAYRLKDYEHAQFLFDSLVQNVIQESYMNNFKVRAVSGKKIDIYEFEKPMYLITSAFWVATSSGEIPALNTLADQYHDQVDFVVLFWGPKKAIVKLKKLYSKNISLVYVDEMENTNDFTIKTMKHSLGFPTTFIIDDSKMIVDVRRNMNHYYEKDYTTSYNEHFQTFMNGLRLILEKDN